MQIFKNEISVIFKALKGKKNHAAGTCNANLKGVNAVQFFKVLKGKSMILSFDNSLIAPKWI